MDSKVAKRILLSLESESVFPESGPVHVGLYGDLSSPVQVIKTPIMEPRSRIPGHGSATARAQGVPSPPPVPSPAPPPPSSSGAPAEDPAFLRRKAVFENKVKVAREDVADELATSRRDVIVVTGFAVLAIGASAGAGILSNAAGFVTTVIAGGGGTLGLATTLKGSLLSYGDLKNVANRKLRHLAQQVQDSQNSQDLDSAETALTDLSTWLDSQVKPSQVASQPSSTN
jgi:hypothetical protein